eukprot:2314962-Amphidinium_carterae.1
MRASLTVSRMSSFRPGNRPPLRSALEKWKTTRERYEQERAHQRTLFLTVMQFIPLGQGKGKNRQKIAEHRGKPIFAFSKLQNCASSRFCGADLVRLSPLNAVSLQPALPR